MSRIFVFSLALFYSNEIRLTKLIWWLCVLRLLKDNPFRRWKSGISFFFKENSVATRQLSYSDSPAIYSCPCIFGWYFPPQTYSAYTSPTPPNSLQLQGTTYFLIASFVVLIIPQAFPLPAVSYRTQPALYRFMVNLYLTTLSVTPLSHWLTLIAR